MANPTRVPLIYGAAAFGVRDTNSAPRIHTLPECQEMIDAFVKNGHHTFDTARFYGEGTSEEFLGQLDLKGAHLDTKIVSIAPGDLAPERLRTTFKESLTALGPHKIRILYLHAPDRSVSYEDTVREVNELFKQGYFEEFGLSNFQSWEVAEIVGISKANGWIKPTVYQGLYNALERTVENELIPCLRKFGIKFYAYSPLSGGLLTGTVLTPNDLNVRPGTRWDPKICPLAPWLQDRYRPLVPVFAELKVALDEHNIRLSEAALRWLQHHSVLGPSDGVVIGASRVKQLESNLKDSEGGPLPENIVKLIDEGWAKAKGQAPYYAA